MLAVNSILFVPGSRPDRFDKARSAGAGLTVIDLEDAVRPADKAQARADALAEVARDAADLAVRINPVTTAAGIADLAALGEAELLPRTLLVPMVEHAVELRIIAGALGDRCPALVPLIETPRGLREAVRLGDAGAPLAALMFGGGDLSAELGVALAWEPLLAARSQFVLACAELGLPAIDVPWIAIDDETGLAKECRRASALGFSGKAAIHPRQVPAIEEAFAPTAEELAEAEDALDAFEKAGGSVISYRGRMLEAPIVRNYRAVVARSRSSKGNIDA